MEEKQENKKQNHREHPMDVVRRKALSWDKHHKFSFGSKTIWSVLKAEYGDDGAGKLLQLIDFIIEQTAREVLLSEPKQYQRVDGKEALVVPYSKFEVLTKLAGIDTSGRKVRDTKGFYVRVDNFVGLSTSPKKAGHIFYHDIFDAIAND
jgi:hypothetical protein